EGEHQAHDHGVEEEQRAPELGRPQHGALAPGLRGRHGAWATSVPQAVDLLRRVVVPSTPSKAGGRTIRAIGMTGVIDETLDHITARRRARLPDLARAG